MLVLCCAGGTMAVFRRRLCAGAGFGIAVATVYGCGVILFFVSDRFRLPLLPFLCIGAGVWACGVKDLFEWLACSFRENVSCEPGTIFSSQSKAAEDSRTPKPCGFSPALVNPTG